MSESILIRSTMRTWDLTLGILSGIGLFLYAISGMANANKGLVIVLEATSLCLIVTLILILRRRIETREWITVGPDQFTLTGRSKHVTYQDQDVQSIAIRTKRNFSNGEFTSVTRSVILWIADPEEQLMQQVKLVNKIKVDHSDPLADFINRLNQRVLTQARDLLDSHRQFTGDGWELGMGELVIAAKPESLRCRLDDISLFRVVDEKLCFWRKGATEPWGRIDIHSVNVWVLSELLEEKFKDRPDEVSDLEVGELGEVIFERKTRFATRIVLLLGACVLFLLSIAVVIAALAEKREETLSVVIVGILFIAGFVATATGFINSLFFRFRCHRMGLIKTNLMGTRQLQYKQVADFTYNATRQFVNGVYTGTSLAMEFVPFADMGLKPIKFSATLQNMDTELDNLREFISGVVGSRMCEDVAAGKSVTWTPELTFQGDSLYYTAAGFIGRKATQAFVIRELDKYRFNDGHLELFQGDNPKPVIRASTQQKNFFPGFHCWLRLVNTPVQTPRRNELDF